MRRLLGFLLILKGLSLFIWLIAGYFVADAIVERFGRVSGHYSTELSIQVDAYDALAERVAEQIEAIEPTVRAAVQQATEDFYVLLAYVEETVAQIKRLPTIDLSQIMPEIRLPAIQLPNVTLNWKVPNIPIVREVVNAIKTAVQGVVNGVNSAFSAMGTAVRNTFNAAFAPLREQLAANVMRQIRPYLDAYERVSRSMALVGLYYDSLAAKFAGIQAELAKAAAVWQQIGDDLAEQIGLSITLVNTMPSGLGTAMGESAMLLAFFALFTLGLFLLFHGVAMMNDIERGWCLMTGRYDVWKRKQAEPKEPALDRWLAKLEAKEAEKSAT